MNAGIYLQKQTDKRKHFNSSTKNASQTVAQPRLITRICENIILRLQAVIRNDPMNQSLSISTAPLFESPTTVVEAPETQIKTEQELAVFSFAVNRKTFDEKEIFEKIEKIQKSCRMLIGGVRKATVSVQNGNKHIRSGEFIWYSDEISMDLAYYTKYCTELNDQYNKEEDDWYTSTLAEFIEAYDEMLNAKPPIQELEPFIPRVIQYDSSYQNYEQKKRRSGSDNVTAPTRYGVA
jgi:hypothetical protein